MARKPRQVRLILTKNVTVQGQFRTAGTRVTVDAKLGESLTSKKRRGGSAAKGVRGPDKAERSGPAETPADDQRPNDEGNGAIVGQGAPGAESAGDMAEPEPEE